MPSSVPRLTEDVTPPISTFSTNFHNFPHATEPFFIFCTACNSSLSPPPAPPPPSCRFLSLPFIYALSPSLTKPPSPLPLSLAFSLRRRTHFIRSYSDESSIYPASYLAWPFLFTLALAIPRPARAWPRQQVILPVQSHVKNAFW